MSYDEEDIPKSCWDINKEPMTNIIKSKALATEGETKVLMNADEATILGINVRDGGIVLHYLEPSDDHQDEDDMEERTFIVLSGNGHAVPDHYEHHATLNMNVYTWHVFEIL